MSTDEKKMRIGKCDLKGIVVIRGYGIVRYTRYQNQ